MVSFVKFALKKDKQPMNDSTRKMITTCQGHLQRNNKLIHFRGNKDKGQLS